MGTGLLQVDNMENEQFVFIIYNNINYIFFIYNMQSVNLVKEKRRLTAQLLLALFRGGDHIFSRIHPE